MFAIRIGSSLLQGGPRPITHRSRSRLASLRRAVIPDSYLAAGVTALTEIVPPLAVPVTSACCQASLFSSADTA
jgi:hypothetical protein